MAMIGRITEIEELEDLYNSGKAELVAVYGRRRVGKTYLIDQAFKGKITFRHAGLAPSEDEEESTTQMKDQLDSVNNVYYRTILKRQEILRNELSPKVSIQSTLVTTFGLAKGEYEGAFSNVVTLEDLFAEV
jgi:hypothetical protein